MDITPTQELAGRVAVVTGSSTGIGRAILLQLAAAGAHCVVHAVHSKERAEAVAAEARALGVQAECVWADFYHDSDCRRLVETVLKTFGQIDIWVNNAGADILTGDAKDWPFEQKLAALWQVDVQGTMVLSRLVGQHMKQRGQGCILNIGWDQAELGMAGDSGELFAATKGATMAFTRSLAKSLAPEVRVNCIAPGWIRTAWGEQAPDYWQSRAHNESLLGRWGEPADIAAMARFLASPAASFVTGQVIAVNGGFKASAMAAASK